MNCEHVREQLADFLAGTLDEAARPAIEQHLATCQECSGAVEMWTRLGALPDEQPSPALAARFESMLAAYQEGLDHTTRKGFSLRQWIESWWPKQPAFQFGIAVACLCAGVFAGHLIPFGAGRQEIAELRKEVRTTRQLVAVSLLQQQSASERLRGVSYADRITRPDSEVLSALLRAVKYDSSVDVRLGAVDALRRYINEPSVRSGLLDALRPSQSPLVQIELIDLMVEARERQAETLLQQLKDDKEVNQEVRERAVWGLQRL